MAATTRLAVPVGPGTLVPELQDERFGALITYSFSATGFVSAAD